MTAPIRISILYSLPEDLIYEVVSLWLITSEVASLDCATFNKEWRSLITKLLLGMPATCSYVEHNVNYAWIKQRGLTVTHFVSVVLEKNIFAGGDDGPLDWSKLESLELHKGIYMYCEKPLLLPLNSILPLCTALKRCTFYFDDFEDGKIKEMFSQHNHFEHLQLFSSAYVYTGHRLKLETLKTIFTASPNLREVQCRLFETIKGPAIEDLGLFLLNHPSSLKGKPIKCELRMYGGHGTWRGLCINGTEMYYVPIEEFDAYWPN